VAASLLLPSPQTWRPLAQTAAVLVLGQGFARAGEFLMLARRLTTRITEVPSFKEAGSLGPRTRRSTR
jgi:hypothetical protein